MYLSPETIPWVVLRFHKLLNQFFCLSASSHHSDRSMKFLVPEHLHTPSGSLELGWWSHTSNKIDLPHTHKVWPKPLLPWRYHDFRLPKQKKRSFKNHESKKNDLCFLCGWSASTGLQKHKPPTPIFGWKLSNTSRHQHSDTSKKSPTHQRSKR